MAVNDDIYDRAVHRSAMARLYERNVQGKVEKIIDDHKDRTSKLILQSNPKSPSFDTDLNLEIATSYDLAYNTSKRSLLDLFGDQVSYMYQNLEAGVGRIYRVFRPEGRIAEEIVLERPLHKDKTLMQGWAGISGREKVEISNLIRRGLSKGLSISEIALLVRQGNPFAISRAQAFGLVRTAITSVQSQADHEVYKINKEVLKGYQYVAVLDSRTTPVCAALDTKVFPIGDIQHLPPQHWNCRSTTTPVVLDWDTLANSESLSAIRKKNLDSLTDKQKAYYDGLSPAKESYDEWLRRQPNDIQLKHLGDFNKLELFRSGQLKLERFSNADGKSIGIKELRKLTDSGYAVPGTTARFALAREKLDAIKLGASRPEDFYNDKQLVSNLKEYFLLQNGDLDGTLALMPYRGINLGTKKLTKQRVLNKPPSEDQLIFNPVSGRYEDARILPPSHDAYDNSIRLMNESTTLKDVDKEFITKFSESLENSMGVNERAVVVDNLRNLFSRYRVNGEPWGNFKAVVQGQIKFDVMNISDFIETNLRRDQNLIKRLKQENYFDPVLGEVQLQELHDSFIDNIFERNRWEDKVAPKIAKELRSFLDLGIPYKIRNRLEEKDIEAFYKRFAGRLSLADTPDRDQLAISLGRDLYNLANYRGTKRQWYNLGLDLLNRAEKKGFFKLEVMSTQKKRLKSKMFGGYVGPYYDTRMVVLRIVDPRIQRYSKLNRLIDVGLRLGVTVDKNRLMIRKGKKTYFDRWYRDTRIPITSTSSYPDFPEELISRDMEQALNWAANAKFKIDDQFYDFIEKLLLFEDDKGKAQYYNELNHFKEYIIERGDSYERFKAMKWLRNKGAAFSNHPFLDHRARIYERGMIGPQSGETFRPFLNTADEKPLGVDGFYNFQDIIGATLGGISDAFEGRYNSLSQLGRQQIAEYWRPKLVEVGNLIQRGKPNDIRKILDDPFMSQIEGEEQAKVLRLALEVSKIDNYLKEKSSQVFQEFESWIPWENRDVIDVNRALRIAHDKPTSEIKISKVRMDYEDAPILDNPNETFSAEDEKRIADADLSVPILVEKFNSQFVWVDGWHRMVKASRLGIKEIPAKVLTHDEVLSAVVDKSKVWKRGAVPPYSEENLRSLDKYKISIALEQDASSSGAQIIALTTRNKQLAELSNVVPTKQKQRLYDEIAAATFNDPRFRELNLKLGLTEKDLRKAAKAQNMVTFYGAGERTGILNVENKLAKALGKDKTRLIVRASERDAVLNEISARAARYKEYDPETFEELQALRQDVKDIFNKGEVPGDDIINELSFLDPKTKDFVEKLSRNYSNRVTPEDFSTIAKIMSENLRQQVPILKEFTRYFGRLAKDYLAETKQLNIPWKTFDNKTIEQYFSMVFEERLVYKTEDGRWVNNFIQVSQKTNPSFFDEVLNKDGKIRDISDAQKAATAFAVNGE